AALGADANVPAHAGCRYAGDRRLLADYDLLLAEPWPLDRPGGRAVHILYAAAVECLSKGAPGWWAARCALAGPADRRDRANTGAGWLCCRFQHGRRTILRSAARNTLHRAHGHAARIGERHRPGAPADLVWR